MFQRGPEVRQRLVDGIQPSRALPGSQQGRRRLGVVIAARVVIGDDVDVLVRPLLKEIRDGVRDADVETAPLRQQLLEIGDFLDQCMAEGVGALGIDPASLHEALIDQMVEVDRQRWAGIDPLEHAVPEGPADDGGRTNDARRAWSEAVDARPQHFLHAVGNNQRQ